MPTDLPLSAPSSGNPLVASILVVNDSAENARLLIQILERGGYAEVTGITDPRLVLDQVKDITPALVILDLHMPHTDGFAVMREIRSLVHDVPKFLLVTGDIEEEVRSNALAGGADDLLTKPFRIEDVLLRVRLLLGSTAQHPRRRSQL